MVSDKNRLVALLLCFFLGVFGIHRFYVGKVGTGFLWLISGGIFGIGFLVDLIMIIVGSFTDKSGAFVKDWL
ncbi:MAG: NINE protein [Clostridiales bacterium 43-6]|nr:MAG: NINE protein [Clostridiales bacterium 43-6]